MNTNTIIRAQLFEYSNNTNIRGNTDRHENIGKGTIGAEGFRRIVNCPHFTDIPLILETPLDERIGNKCYQEEISLLHDLIEKS